VTSTLGTSTKERVAPSCKLVVSSYLFHSYYSMLRYVSTTPSHKIGTKRCDGCFGKLKAFLRQCLTAYSCVPIHSRGTLGSSASFLELAAENIRGPGGEFGGSNLERTGDTETLFVNLFYLFFGTILL
jgi:hypothetical protein